MSSTNIFAVFDRLQSQVVVTEFDQVFHFFVILAKVAFFVINQGFKNLS